MSRQHCQILFEQTSEYAYVEQLSASDLTAMIKTSVQKDTFSVSDQINLSDLTGSNEGPLVLRTESYDIVVQKFSRVWSSLDLS